MALRRRLVIDAHQHFWDPASRQAPAIPVDHPLYRPFRPEDLEPSLHAASVDGTVVVQSADSLLETEGLLDLAKRHPFVVGVVGWLPLDQPAATRDALDRFAGEPLLRGVRHLMHMDPDPDWLTRETVIESVRLVGGAGLAFDAVAAQPRHLEQVVALAQQAPQTRIVIDHLGKPPIRGGGWEPWASLMRRCGKCPNVLVKLSGLMTAADPATWTVGDLVPYVDHAIEQFGPERVMWGSDWPVSLQGGDYVTVRRSVEACIASLDDDGKDFVEGVTALRAYGLEMENRPA